MITLLNVALNFSTNYIKVGRLLLKDHKIYFEFAEDFLQTNLPLSPINLPFKPGLQTFDRHLFQGLPGVFNDSLPDGWGRLLFDRAMRAKNIDPHKLSPLDRLAYVGKCGMGALVYEPAISEQYAHEQLLNLDQISQSVNEILTGAESAVLEQILLLNGSSAGARPKALIGLDHTQKQIIHGLSDLPAEYEYWLVKFANSLDSLDSGAIEYTYAQMASKAGIEIPTTHLFTANHGSGYFAIKRFDRQKQQRLHLHSASGLLHADFRLPSLDYQDLISLTLKLTQDMQQVHKMFRLAVFNVLAHNRDDHGKNFSFLMDQHGKWILSPAYDLTFSSGPNGEQSTMVMGQGRNITIAHLYELAVVAGITRNEAQGIITQCQDALAQWRQLASNCGVSQAKIDEIQKVLHLAT